MNDIRFLDEALDINKTITYHLSIQAGLDGFSFVIFDPSRNKFIALKHYGFPEEIAEYKYPETDYPRKYNKQDRSQEYQYGS